MFKRLSTFFLVMLFSVSLTACSTYLAPYDASQPLGEQVNYTITGIDAGAGLMMAAENALEVYGLAEENWQLQPSSTAAMTSTLARAIEDERPIIVTGWIPHWMFTNFDLKFLDDPEGVFGDAESIHTIVRKGLAEDKPSAYQLLNNFYWTPDDMSEVMLEVNNGVEPEEAAREWIENNPDTVAEWTDGIEHVDGEEIVLTLVAWDSEIASTNVVAEVLRDLGYEPTLLAMEIQPMWKSIATGAADAMVAAWLPNTSGAFYEDFKDRVVDLGPNLEGAQVGLAVPSYMKNINSIEDLRR